MKGADKGFWCWACKLLSKQRRVVVKGGIKWGEVVRPWWMPLPTVDKTLIGVILSAGLQYWWCSQHAKDFCLSYFVICNNGKTQHYRNRVHLGLALKCRWMDLAVCFRQNISNLLLIWWQHITLLYTIVNDCCSRSVIASLSHWQQLYPRIKLIHDHVGKSWKFPKKTQIQ